MKEQTNHSIESPFLSLPEACEYLKLKPATLYKYTSNKILPHYKLRGRKVYFKKDDLDSFILNENNYVKSKRQIEAEAVKGFISE